MTKISKHKDGTWLPVSTLASHGQRTFAFANGYGASVVSHAGSYGGDAGLCELAVIRIKGADDALWSIVYDTPVTDDVIGWLDETDVQLLLDEIARLGRGEKRPAEPRFTLTTNGQVDWHSLDDMRNELVLLSRVLDALTVGQTVTLTRQS